MEENQFQYVLRILNTNIKGKEKVTFALTAIKGVGRRFANIITKSAEIDTTKRYVRAQTTLVPRSHRTSHIAHRYRTATTRAAVDAVLGQQSLRPLRALG